MFITTSLSVLNKPYTHSVTVESVMTGPAFSKPDRGFLDKQSLYTNTSVEVSDKEEISE